MAKKRGTGRENLSPEFREAIKICQQVINRLEREGMPLRNLPDDLEDLKNGIAPAVIMEQRNKEKRGVPCVDIALYFRLCAEIG